MSENFSVIDNAGYRGNPLLRRAGSKQAVSQEMMAEWIKCKLDPIYFAEKYVKIITEKGLVPIKLRDYQSEMITSMNDNRFTISLQARQSGKTEIIRAFVLHYILFNEYKTVAILANKEDTAKEILGKIQVSYMNLPLWLQQGTLDFGKAKVIGLENGSRVLAAATSSDAIRGYTIHCLILDEAAFIENFDKFYSAVLPTISAGEETKLIMSSTPNGLNHFYRFWKDAEEGRNQFYKIFVPWDRVPGRTKKWKQETLEAMGNDQAKFEQEYECQFLGSSGTLIAGKYLRELVHQTPETVSEGLVIYKQPEPGRQYTMTCDVSRGKGLDYSAFSIIDVTEMPYQQVCVYRNNMVPPVEYAEILFRIGKHYNNAVALVELNDLGQQAVDSLWERDYENILYTENAGRAGKRICIRNEGKADRGIRTTTTTKATGCALLKLLVEQKQLIINDFHTIEELSRFSRKANSYEAEPGAHDDLVMGLVIFAWLSDQQYFRELTDINTIAKLREKSEDELEMSLLPLGIVTTGQEEFFDEMVDIGYDAFEAWLRD